jgi:hypothetical protein
MNQQLRLTSLAYGIMGPTHKIVIHFAAALDGDVLRISLYSLDVTE